MISPEQIQNSIFGTIVQVIPRTKLEERIIQIEAITGLRNIKSAFTQFSINMNSDIYDEVDIILHWLLKRYNISESENILDIMINLIGFSTDALNSIGANNNEFYYNMTIEESIVTILNKLIITSNDVPIKNGFPEIFNHNRSQNNIIQTSPGGKIYFPFVNNQKINYTSLLNHIIKNFNLDLNNGKLLFHGTSHEGAISINNEIEIIPRSNCTDFGLRNFYVTDTFYTACSWSNRHNQAAVVIFYIPNNFLNVDHKIILKSQPISELNKWKELVFKARNKPRGSENLRNEIREYNRFVQQLDSHNLIEGPICSNPSARNLDSVDYIKYVHNELIIIPEQISFKDSMISLLNNCILLTLYFEDLR